MKLESIFDNWEQDSKIDRTDLGHASLAISELHHKYFKFYSNERLILRKYEADLRQLKLSKFEFYTQGPTKETMELGWVLPPVGKVLKAEVNTYIEADSDVIHLTLKIGVQHEKIELLESIIKTLTNRGFQIKTALDWIKFQSGS